jgi:lactate racemase
MQVKLNYGLKGLNLELSDQWDVTVLKKERMPLPAEPEIEVCRALAQPIGGSPLNQKARGCRTACVAICDITRPVPNGLILPVMIRELLAAGLDPEHITILVATGLHRPNLGEELREVVGDDWVLETVKVVNHDARNSDDHVDLGLTKQGLPIKLDRRFVEADLHLVVGLIEPHFMAGYSGGRKLVLPGVSHHDTITMFHTARFLEHPRATNCVLDGNPLHEAQTEVVRKLGDIAAVNAVIDQDRSLSYINFGEIEASHQAAVEFLQTYAELHCPRRFPTVVTSGGGYPLDKTYYQTVKGLVGAMDILIPGGNLIIVSECSEGLGSPAYVAAQRRLVSMGLNDFMVSLQEKRHAAVDEWQTEMQLKPMRLGHIQLFSQGLSAEEKRLTAVESIDSPEAAIKAALAQADSSSLAVIPEGPYVTPLYRPRCG